MIERKFHLKMMRIRSQKDFEKLRALALMSEVISKAEMEAYFETCFEEYYIRNKALAFYKDDVKRQVMKKFSIWEWDAYEWWYMYIYSSIQSWVYYGLDNPDYFTTFENTANTALKKLERSISNKSIEMLRDEANTLMRVVEKDPPVVERKGEKLTLHLTFVWKSREDHKVCSRCNELEGQTLLEIPEKMPHLNCRCDFVVYEWWTNENGDIVADRSYEIEQNKQSVGYGYSIREAKVTSKMVGGEQVTIFEVFDDGTTRKTTYHKHSDKKS